MDAASYPTVRRVWSVARAGWTIGLATSLGIGSCWLYVYPIGAELAHNPTILRICWALNIPVMATSAVLRTLGISWQCGFDVAGERAFALTAPFWEIAGRHVFVSTVWYFAALVVSQAIVRKVISATGLQLSGGPED